MKKVVTEGKKEFKFLLSLETSENKTIIVSNVYDGDEFIGKEVSEIDLNEAIAKSEKLAADNSKEYNVTIYLTPDLISAIVNDNVEMAKRDIMGKIEEFAKSLELSSSVLELSDDQKSYITNGVKALKVLISKLNDGK